MFGNGLCAAAAAVFLVVAGIAQGLTIHPASAMVRIGGVDGVMPPRAGTYSLRMARNEREGVQFAVLPDGDEPQEIQLTVRAVEPDAPPFVLYRVLAVNHTAPPTEGTFIVPPRRLGWVPDVLMPQEGRGAAGTAVPPKADQPPLTYYLEFRTDRRTRPGTYQYEVAPEPKQMDDSVPSRLTPTLTIELRVHEAAIPVRLPFRTATTWNWTLDEYYGRPLTSDEKRVFWAFCLENRLSPCTFFAKSPDPGPTDLAPLKDLGLNVTNVLFVGGRNPRPLTEQAKEKLGPQLRQWREQLQAIGMADDAYVLLADEPLVEALDVCRANAAWVKQQFPEAKIWVATRPDPAWGEFTDLFDPCMAWSTDFYKPHSHTDESLRWWRESRPYPKGEYWWFHSVEPYAPYTNVRLDNLPIEARVSGWQSALYGVDGYEYVWITDWKANKDSRDVPWPRRAAEWKTGTSGAGTLCYPGTNMRPMPSLRLVNLRDGIEDWALIEMAEPRRLMAARRGLVKPVTTGLAEYTTDPQVLLQARGRVIEGLQRRGPASQSQPAGP